MRNRKNVFNILIILGFYLFSNYWTYTITRESYFGVGISNGRTNQKLEMVETIEKYTEIRPCKEVSSNGELIYFISVKNLDLYIVRDRDLKLDFCKQINEK